MNTRLTRLTFLFVAIWMGAGVPAHVQEDTRKLFESGQFQAVVDQTAPDAPADRTAWPEPGDPGDRPWPWSVLRDLLPAPGRYLFRYLSIFLVRWQSLT